MPTIDNINPYGDAYSQAIPGAGQAPVSPGATSVATPSNAPDTSNFWTQLGAGGYSGLNSVLLGLPDLLVKTAGGSDAYKRLKDYEAQNQIGSTVGDIAGLVGSAFIPGGLALKGLSLGSKLLGAGKAAEALGKGAEFLNATGGTLGQQIARGAGQAAVQAIPRAAIESATTGNPIDTGSVAGQIGLGGGAGAIVGKLLPGLGKLGALGKDETAKTLEDAILSGADAGTRVIKTALNQTAKTYNLSKFGNFFNNADDFKAGLTKFIVDHNLGDKLTREAYIADNGPMWDAVAQKFNASPLNINDPSFVQDFMANPKIAQYLDDPNIGQQGISQIAQRLGGAITDPKTGSIVQDFNQAKSFLTDEITKASKLADNATKASDLDQAQATLHVAGALKQAIDEHALSLDPSFADLKANYPYIQALKIASGLEKIKVENPLKEGSDTFQKLATNAALGGTLGGVTSDEDNKLGGTALGAVGGALGAPFAARLLSKIGTQTVAGLAGKAIQAGENPLIKGATEALGKAGTALAPALPGAAAVAPALVGNAQSTAPSPTIAPEAPLPTPVPTLSPGGATAQPQGEQALPPPPAFVSNPQFQAAMGQKLRSLKAGPYADMDDQTFINAVAKKTNNFNNIPETANVLFVDDPEGKAAFLNEYANYQAVKGLDLNQAIEAGGIFGGIPGTPFKAQAQQLATLKNAALENASGGKPDKETPALEKQFDSDIQALRASRPVGSQQVNPELLAQFVRKWGLDYKNLSNVGVK
jgi:hypothetical protein